MRLLIFAALLLTVSCATGQESTEQDIRFAGKDNLTVSEYAAACGDIRMLTSHETDLYDRIARNLEERKRLNPPTQLAEFHDATLLLQAMIGRKQSLTDEDVLLLTFNMHAALGKLDPDVRGTLEINGCVDRE